MFSGIIEGMGTVVSIVKDKENVHLTLSCDFTKELKVDQSLSHNGVCLTVVEIEGNCYTVTAIKETLIKSNLGLLAIGDKVNLERSMKMDGRLDGHIVQGHVDQTAVCQCVAAADGSWYYTFSYDFDRNKARQGYMTVEKGSVTVNGVSLTVVNSEKDSFQVAIIPYTYEHTNFHAIQEGSTINLEFDIIGKYLSRLAEFSNQMP
jgi:riboflavin synthase